MQAELGRLEGVYAEASSVTTLVNLQTLAASGKVKPEDKIVAIITSTGLKDPAATAARMPKVPVITPEASVLSSALDKYYGAKLF